MSSVLNFAFPLFYLILSRLSLSSTSLSFTFMRHFPPSFLFCSRDSFYHPLYFFCITILSYTLFTSFFYIILLFLLHTIPISAFSLYFFLHSNYSDMPKIFDCIFKNMPVRYSVSVRTNLISPKKKIYLSW